MSLYQVQKFLYHLNRDDKVKAAYHSDLVTLLADYELTQEEQHALTEGDVGKLYVIGVNGQILMHFAALLGIEWFDYLERMREGVRQHGPVRDGVYAMTGGGASFTSSSHNNSKPTGAHQ